MESLPFLAGLIITLLIHSVSSTFQTLTYCSTSTPSSPPCKTGQYTHVYSVKTNPDCFAALNSLGWENKGLVQNQIWSKCNLHKIANGKECSPTFKKATKISMEYECLDSINSVHIFNMCKNLSKTVKTPFYLTGGNYPGQASFKAGQTCSCRVTTMEKYPFSFLVKQFHTSGSDNLLLSWIGGRKEIKNGDNGTYDVTQHLSELTMTFKLTKFTSGVLFLAVESEQRHWRLRRVEQETKLECRDRPFAPRTVELCTKYSGLVQTPFFINSPGYPDIFTFPANKTCSCQAYSVEPERYPFSLAVKKFKTKLRNGLGLTWYNADNETGTTHAVSEPGQDTTFQMNQKELLDVTVRFNPVKSGSGEISVAVESEEKLTMNVHCIDGQMPPDRSAEQRRLIYILFNAVPIGIIALLGLIIIIPLFCMLIFGKGPTGPKTYPLGTVDPTIKVSEGPVAPVAPVASGSRAGSYAYDSPIYEKPEPEPTGDPPTYDDAAAMTRL